MGCVTVEIEVEKTTNILISCIYRTPGSCLVTINEKMVDMYDNRHNNKIIIVCGDFNLDLLKLKEHKPSRDFIDTMHRTPVGLLTTILKPTRITTDSATLINNIFTNEIGNRVLSGLLINDISDHLPVFATLQNFSKENTQRNSKIAKMIRKKTPDSIEALKEGLRQQTWTDVYLNHDPNKAYDEFMSTFTTLYDKNCPLQQLRTNKYEDKPWITRGPENACKNKNVLYKQFLQIRTKEAENKYKKYKNKLTSILRTNKKDYFNKQLVQKRHRAHGRC